MTNDLLAQIPVAGNYVAIWKVAIFFVGFGLWAWVGQWIDKDTIEVHTRRDFWNNVYLGTGVAAILGWFVLPAPFIVEWLLFLAIWLTISVLYVLHRNARVPNELRILNAEHIKHVLSRDSKGKQKQRDFVFISSHGNELPVPTRQDEESAGHAGAENLIYDMWQRRVASADVSPGSETVQPRYTIDGMIVNAGEYDREQMDHTVAYLKAVAGLEVADRRRPQTGQFKTRVEGNNLEWRLSTAGSVRGEQMVIEKIEEAQTLVIDELGFNADQLGAMQKAIDQRGGVIIICGTGGCGLTTTLYSIVRHHDAFTQNIHSLEMNPLTDLDNITQNILESGTTPRDAARRLQSVLRSDPDIVLVGFCNSPEMARIAAKATENDKKLYLGMTQQSTVHALQEWIKMVDKPQRAADSLLAITCQKLLRKLCPECREAYAPDANMLRKLSLPADRIKQFFRPPTQFEYDKQGNPILCEHCQGTGYYGRTAVFETLFVSDALREMIKEQAPINTLRTQCRKERMLFLQEQALRKVIDGTTSIQEVLRITAEKKPKPAGQKTASKQEEEPSPPQSPEPPS